MRPGHPLFEGDQVRPSSGPAALVSTLGPILYFFYYSRSRTPRPAGVVNPGRFPPFPGAEPPPPRTITLLCVLGGGSSPAAWEPARRFLRLRISPPIHVLKSAEKVPLSLFSPVGVVTKDTDVDDDLAVEDIDYRPPSRMTDGYSCLRSLKRLYMQGSCISHLNPNLNRNLLFSIHITCFFRGESFFFGDKITNFLHRILFPNIFFHQRFAPE